MHWLQEASYEMTHAAMAKTTDDERLLVTFAMSPHIDQAESDKQGRPIYTEKEYVTIMVPGDKESIVNRPAWDKDRLRFPKQYAAFKNKQDQAAVSGTPLKLMPWLTLGQIKELEYFNCHTVEQLANMPDSHTIKFMALNKFKQLAKDYLQAAKEAAPLTAMRAEIDKKDSQLAAAMQQVQALAKRLEVLEGESRNK